MAKPVLKYFNARGVIEASRICYGIKGVDFEGAWKAEEECLDTRGRLWAAQAFRPNDRGPRWAERELE